MISSAPAAAIRPTWSITHAGVDAALERAAERGAERRGGAQARVVGGGDHGRGAGGGLLDGGVLVAPREGVGDRVGEVDLAAPAAVARSSPLRLSTSAARTVPSRRESAAKTSSAPAICGTRCGLTKLAASTRGRPVSARRSHSPPDRGRERLAVVLEAVARPDVAQGDPHPGLNDRNQQGGGRHDSGPAWLTDVVMDLAQQPRVSKSGPPRATTRAAFRARPTPRSGAWSARSRSPAPTTRPSSGRRSTPTAPGSCRCGASASRRLPCAWTASSRWCSGSWA